MDCLGTKKTRWQRNSSPEMSGDKDKLVEKPLLPTIWWGENKRKKKTPQHLKLCDYKSPSSPKQQPMKNKDKTKRKLDSKTSQMLLIHLLHITRQGLSPGRCISSGSWNWSVAGTPGGTWPPLQQKMGGRCLGQPGLCALPLQLSAAGGLEWPYGARAVPFFLLWCHGWPSWVTAMKKKGRRKRSEEKVLPGPETKTKGSFCLALPQLLGS